MFTKAGAKRKAPPQTKAGTAKTTATKAVAKGGVVAAAKAGAPAKAAPRAPFRPRLLPVTIFGAVLLLGARVVDLWSVATTRDAPLPEIQASEAKDTSIITPAGERLERRAAQMASSKGTQVAAADQPKAPEGDKKGAEKPKEGQPAEGEAPKEGEASSDPLSPIGDEQLLKHYAERRAELEKQAKDVSMREALLSAAEKRIEQKLKELEKVRGEIKNLLKLGDERQSQQLESLVKIYETMKPKDAARIFEELELPVLLDVIQKMKETKTAPILAAMDPVKAKEVTSALVERRILPSIPQ